MRTISPLDLRRSLGAILDAASAGERILVERDHRPVAVIVSVEDGLRLGDDPVERRQRTVAALDRLEAIGRAQGSRLGVPPDADGPSATEAVRLDRERDDG